MARIMRTSQKCSGWTLASVLSLALLTATLSGCGSEPLERHAVFGSIQVDKSIDVHGSIRFFPNDGNRGPAAATAVVGGRYEFTSENGPVSGPHRVEVGIAGTVQTRGTSNSATTQGKGSLLSPNAEEPSDGKPSDPEPRRKWTTTFDVPIDPTVHKDFSFEIYAAPAVE